MRTNERMVRHYLKWQDNKEFQIPRKFTLSAETCILPGEEDERVFHQEYEEDILVYYAKNAKRFTPTMGQRANRDEEFRHARGAAKRNRKVSIANDYQDNQRDQDEEDNDDAEYEEEEEESSD